MHYGKFFGQTYSFLNSPHDFTMHEVFGMFVYIIWDHIRSIRELCCHKDRSKIKTPWLPEL